MLDQKSVAVVIPVFNEVRNIRKVIETLPDFIDKVVIVDDGSTDGTVTLVKSLITAKEVDSKYEDEPSVSQEYFVDHNTRYFRWQGTGPDDRIILLSHPSNLGKGAGIKTGYHFCRLLEMDCTATMDGDGQMDPNELEDICKPIVEEGIDYVKGNRLSHKDAWKVIPLVRIIGNIILSALTKPCSGYWTVNDTQTGFTAISRHALLLLPVEKIYPYYGYPNDILVKLNICGCTLREVDVLPIYNNHDDSKMKLYKVIPGITLLLFRSFFYRIWAKYFVQKLHPVGFVFSVSMILLPAACLSAILCGAGSVHSISYLLAALAGFFLSGILDWQENKKLYK